MTSPEIAEEVLDDLDVLRARDPRGLLPAVAGAGAQVRETDRLTQEADLSRVIGVLRDAKYSGYVVLEYEAREDPATAVPKSIKKLRSLIG